MAQPYWTTDYSRWPVAVVHVVDGDGVAKPEIESFFRQLEELLQRGERGVVVLDLNFAVPDAARRRRFVDWVKTHTSTVDPLMLGSAIVAPSAFHRGLVVAVRWLIDLPAERMQVFATRAEAIAWGERCVVQARAKALKR